MITIVAGFGAGYWKAHADAQATELAQSRLVRGSVRAWRDDLYESEELLGLAIKSRYWTAERERSLANGQDYKEVSRSASWNTWRRLSSARDALNRLYRTWNRPRRLTAANVALLSDVLVFAEYARLDLARERGAGREGLSSEIRDSSRSWAMI